jgi:hypothetical protein
MIMQAVPTWRDEPEVVFININILGKDDWSGQILAEFRARGQVYVVTVDEDLIDQPGKRMPALIIADVGADDYLVDLPGESLSAGSRVLVETNDIKRMDQW